MNKKRGPDFSLILRMTSRTFCHLEVLYLRSYITVSPLWKVLFVLSMTVAQHSTTL